MKEGLIIVAIIMIAVIVMFAIVQFNKDDLAFEQNMATPSPLTEGDSIADIEEDLNNLDLLDEDPDLSAIEEQL